jgi:hypothetical protein
MRCSGASLLGGAVARGAQYDVRRLHDECELGTVLDASVRQGGAGSQHRVATQQPLSGRPAASSTGHAPGRAHCALQHLAHCRGAVQDQRRDLRPADSRHNYAHGACAAILLHAQTPRGEGTTAIAAANRPCHFAKGTPPATRPAPRALPQPHVQRRGHSPNIRLKGGKWRAVRAPLLGNRFVFQQI